MALKFATLEQFKGSSWCLKTHKGEFFVTKNIFIIHVIIDKKYSSFQFKRNTLSELMLIRMRKMTIRILIIFKVGYLGLGLGR